MTGSRLKRRWLFENACTQHPSPPQAAKRRKPDPGPPSSWWGGLAAPCLHTAGVLVVRSFLPKLDSSPHPPVSSEAPLPGWPEPLHTSKGCHCSSWEAQASSPQWLVPFPGGRRSHTPAILHATSLLPRLTPGMLPSKHLLPSAVLSGEWQWAGLGGDLLPVGQAANWCYIPEDLTCCCYSPGSEEEAD